VGAIDAACQWCGEEPWTLQQEPLLVALLADHGHAVGVLLPVTANNIGSRLLSRGRLSFRGSVLLMQAVDPKFR
jgi:hypothetical protein